MDNLTVSILKALPLQKRLKLKVLRKLAKSDWSMIREVLEIPDIELEDKEGYWKIDFWRGELRLDNKFNWYWDDDIQESFLTWVIRLAKSGFKEEVVKRLGEAITFEQFKALCFISLFNKDGLWAFTGDNRYWYFEEGKGEDIVEAMRSYLEGTIGLKDDEVINEIIDDAYWHVKADYDTFKEEYWRWFYKLMKEVLNRSRSIEDVFNYFNSEDAFWDAWEARDEFIYNRAVRAIWKAKGRFLKKKLKELEDIRNCRKLTEFVGGG